MSSWNIAYHYFWTGLNDHGKHIIPLSGNGPRGKFKDFVELVLTRSGSTSTMGEVEEDSDCHLHATDTEPESTPIRNAMPTTALGLLPAESLTLKASTCSRVHPGA